MERKAANGKNREITVSPAPYYGPGPTVLAGEIICGFVAEGDEEVELILYDKSTHELLGEFSMPVDPLRGSVRSISVKGVRPQSLTYHFRVEGKDVPDPAARLLDGKRVFGAAAGGDGPEYLLCSLPQRTFNWQEDPGALHIPYEQVIAYCLHVRGFTKMRGSRVKHPGTFKGLAEKIPYLLELGINQIILMPAYEFAETTRSASADPIFTDPAAAAPVKINYWGYGPGYYFAPKASYASSAAPDTEFKSMVKAMHRAGIEVVMEFAFSDQVSMDYMARCLSWWLREYHVDGFVLMTAPDRARELASYPLLSRCKLMTGWFDTDRIYSSGRKTQEVYLADLNDGFKRDARHMLKGDSDALKGFVRRMRENSRDKAQMNYITGHDGFTLADLVSYNEKHNEENGEDNRDGSDNELSWNCGEEGPTRKRQIRALRLRQMKNALTMLMCAQGTPILLAGDEFANTQGGNNNPWCLDSEVTWLDWRSLKNQQELFGYTKELIALRKAHPSLHRGGPLTGAAHVSGGFPDFSIHADRAWYVSYDPESRHVGMMLCGEGKDGQDDYLYIACNAHWESREFALPYLPEGMTWRVCLDTAGLPEAGEVYPVRSFALEGRSIRILEGVSCEVIRQKNPYDDRLPEIEMSEKPEEMEKSMEEQDE